MRTIPTALMTHPPTAGLGGGEREGDARGRSPTWPARPAPLRRRLGHRRPASAPRGEEAQDAAAGSGGAFHAEPSGTRRPTRADSGSAEGGRSDRGAHRPGRGRADGHGTRSTVRSIIRPSFPPAQSTTSSPRSWRRSERARRSERHAATRSAIFFSRWRHMRLASVPTLRPRQSRLTRALRTGRASGAGRRRHPPPSP